MAEGVVNTRRVRSSGTAPSVVLSAKKYLVMLCATARRARTLRRRMKHQEQRRRSASSKGALSLPPLRFPDQAVEKAHCDILVFGL